MYNNDLASPSMCSQNPKTKDFTLDNYYNVINFILYGKPFALLGVI